MNKKKCETCLKKLNHHERKVPYLHIANIGAECRRKNAYIHQCRKCWAETENKLITDEAIMMYLHA